LTKAEPVLPAARQPPPVREAILVLGAHPTEQSVRLLAEDHFERFCWEPHARKRRPKPGARLTQPRAIARLVEHTGACKHSRNPGIRPLLESDRSSRLNDVTGKIVEKVLV
jgi:hypothetical protein